MNNDIIQNLFDVLEMRATTILAFKSEISKKFNVSKNEIHNIILYLKDAGYLLLPDNHTNIAMLTSKGFDMKNGGWLNYLEREREKRKINTITIQHALAPKKKAAISVEVKISLTALILTFIGLLFTIPETTKYFGILWWKNYLKI